MAIPATHVGLVTHTSLRAPCARRAVYTPALASTSGLEAAPKVRLVSRDHLEEADSQLIRAASYLRAHSFGIYPKDRSEYAKRAHLLILAKDALEQMQCGLGISNGLRAAEEVSNTSNVVAFFPVIASLRRSDISTGHKYDDDDLAAIESVISGGVHLHIPTSDPEQTEYVCGTLDVTVGNKLPSEELVGKMGERDNRAYLSNVCVLASLRKRGVARTMIEDACAYAGELGVAQMYVHVVEDNVAARKLYEEKCGFSVEQKEPANVARGLNRPPRLLLHRKL